MLGVRCNKYDSRQMCTSVAAAAASADVENICTAEGVFEGGGLFTVKRKTIWGFPMSPTRLGEAESNPLFFRANSARFNAPSAATVLGRDRDMRRNVPTAPLLAPKPNVLEKVLGRRGAA